MDNVCLGDGVAEGCFVGELGVVIMERGASGQPELVGIKPYEFDHFRGPDTATSGI